MLPTRQLAAGRSTSLEGSSARLFLIVVINPLGMARSKTCCAASTAGAHGCTKRGKQQVVVRPCDSCPPQLQHMLMNGEARKGEVAASG